MSRNNTRNRGDDRTRQGPVGTGSAPPGYLPRYFELEHAAPGRAS
jgi:hypothetical protein